jgi:hypothetical protein
MIELMLTIEPPPVFAICSGVLAGAGSARRADVVSAGPAW